MADIEPTGTHAGGGIGGGQGSDRPSGMLMAAVYVFAGLASAGMLAVALTQRGGGESTLIVASIGMLGLVFVACTSPLAMMLSARREDSYSERRMVDELVQTRRAIESMREEAALSDDARRAINRRRERELLRRAIEEDIAAQEWEAAMLLCGELSDRFGYRQDAEEARARIESARYEYVMQSVNAATSRVDQMIIQRRWDEAWAEARRIGRLYRELPRAAALERRVDQAREMYKADLERRFLTSAREDRVDDAMSLLKELDAYLSEGEAAPYREVARGVIGKARNNLGAQFKLAVKDRQWSEAHDIGQRILREFPNSRMADEVRQLIDAVRERATGTAAAGHPLG
ncbi:MAG: hypothetical protein KF902_05785 [Phycisphaeraceae bacterium]|nr:hypothetical protein [Phycisphaeraceae bacterium]